VRFDYSCNLRATATEYPFLLLRQKPEHLYDVRFVGSLNTSLWTYFAYVDGGFRYIGNFKKTELGVREEQSPTGPSSRIRVGGTVAAAKLIHQVLPVYPQDAKAEGMQGAVILHAIIATDGSIRDLYLNEGQCLLTQSAMNAVKQWRYAPTTLNGNPVEVDTTIQVIYTLAH
jgi:TonB family protein